MQKCPTIFYETGFWLSGFQETRQIYPLYPLSKPLDSTTAPGRFTALENNSEQRTPADMWENYVSAPTACSGQRRKGEEGERGKMCISRPLAIFYEPGRSFPRKSSSENICLGVKFGRG